MQVLPCEWRGGLRGARGLVRETACNIGACINLLAKHIHLRRRTWGWRWQR